MGQEGNKHKTSAAGKVKDVRETNITINRNLVTQNVYVPRRKSLFLNLSTPIRYQNPSSYTEIHVVAIVYLLLW